jgi:para-aminobenzoate synthetase / 4-amino-4-deoxychorismate lyase
VEPVADAHSVLLVESRVNSDQYDQARDERALLFRAPRRIIACREPSQVERCLQQADEALRAGHYVAGFLSYEAGYGLHPKLAGLAQLPATEHTLWLGVFDGVRELRGQQVAQLLAARAARAAGHNGSVSELRFELARAQYRRDFEQIQAHLHAGDSYQVCHSLRTRFRVSGHPAALLDRLRAAQPTAYSALIELDDYSIVSLSPELFFRKSQGRVLLKPMKGTLQAGQSEQENAALAEGMRRDAKTTAENVMIVDLLRNDIGRLARPGSVRVPELFAVERFGGVLQMTSTIVAEVEPDLGLSQLMQALFPSGSVTGAPKLRTMEIIRELESSPRGIFCGSIGYATPGGDACFNVAIRSLCIDLGGQAVLGVGSGVVVDSTSDAEYDECLLKARFVTAAG